MIPQRGNRVKVSALLRAVHKVSEGENLVGVSRTTVYAIEKRMNDGEEVNRHANSCRKTVVNRDSLRDAIRVNVVKMLRKQKIVVYEFIWCYTEREHYCYRLI